MESDKKIISYSLFGSNDRYLLPLLENSISFKKLFPGWLLYVYHDHSVPSTYLEKLTFNQVITINVEENEKCDLPPKAWRFIPVTQRDVKCVIFRDADSLLTVRESVLVQTWINSDKAVHIIRDHPLHIAPILAGMFGVKKESFYIFSQLLASTQFNVASRPVDYDQVFLGDHFYPRIRNNALIHTSFFKFYNENVSIIDSVDDGYNYIGSVYSEIDFEKEENKKLILNSKFVSGIPFELARILRYRVRPTFYSSLFLNFVYLKLRNFF